MNLDQRIHHFVNLRNEKKDTINAMLEMQLVELKKDSQTLVVQFPLQSWKNESGESYAWRYSVCYAGCGHGRSCLCFFTSSFYAHDPISRKFCERIYGR